MAKPITKCPYCRSEDGLYYKFDLINIPFNINFDGTAGYNAEMYDNAESNVVKTGLFCQRCGKLVCRMDTLKKRNGIAEL